MRTRKIRYHMADFETTVFSGQKYTEVWAAAIVGFFTEEVKIYNSLQKFLNYVRSLSGHNIIYFHNLKFDGIFILDYFLRSTNYRVGLACSKPIVFKDLKELKSGEYTYTISDMGQWYDLTLKTAHGVVEFRDSLKLLPFSVEQIGKSFKTKHQKLNIEYEGFRQSNQEISPQEKEYIKNDVLVPKEALEIMLSQGHDKPTIGSCCLSEFKRIIKTETAYEYENLFPNLYEIECPLFEDDTAGDFIRKSYRGGWCYYVPGKSGRILKNGLTLDVNSLYPSMMHSESGNEFPVGKPIFWKGNFIHPEALFEHRYYFIRIKTRFYLKDGRLPFIQIKNSYFYKGNENLISSDILDPKTKKRYNKIIAENSEIDTRVELTLTCTDFELLKNHYELVDFEILGGAWFYSLSGVFDKYINKYREIKETTKDPVQRMLAKLFLNNLYGQLARSTNSSFKFAYLNAENIVSFTYQDDHNKRPGYIPCGSAITSYARCFTITAAQKNFHGENSPGFAYADTDSIHCNDITIEEITGVPLHDKKFCHWKHESSWDKAIFARQKTYIERVIQGEERELDIKCAGMSERCKEFFEESLSGANMNRLVDLKEEEREFLFDMETMEPKVRSLEDFKVGLCVPGKLMPKRIIGGVILQDTTFEMR